MKIKIGIVMNQMDVIYKWWNEVPGRQTGEENVKRIIKRIKEEDKNKITHEQQKNTNTSFF